MKIVFMGTPFIAAECLRTLLSMGVDVVAIVSQPDKAKDRKQKFIFSPVKQLALDNNILLFQPNKIKEIEFDLATLDIDMIITCAYGQFIPDSILTMPSNGSYNIHASMLPKLRGGAPIHWAIINRLEKTGITIMKMVKKMDAGDIVFQSSFEIDNDETYKSLLQRLINLAKIMLRKHYFDLINSNFEAQPQEAAAVTFGYNINKSLAIIDFNKPACEIDALIRGLFDKPIARCYYDDKLIKIHHAKISSFKSKAAPGTITKIDKNGVYVASQDYDIEISMLQLPNKKALMISALINGSHPFQVGGIWHNEEI